MNLRSFILAVVLVVALLATTTPSYAAKRTLSRRLSTASIKIGQPVHITGRLTPAARSGTVWLERHYAGHWHKIKSSTLTSHSTYDIAFKPDVAGTLQYRTEWSTVASPSVKLKVRPGPAHFGDGTFRVGHDIAAGTYRTRSAVPECYWARLSGFGGSDIIENGGFDGFEVVTIRATDKGFESHRCGTWTKDLSAVTKSRTGPFGAGIYIVGTDIAAGTWRSSATGSDCYWARLSGFGGGEIIDNGGFSSHAIVTIDRSDRGFQNHRCGTWTKIG
jgi:hypothetical protein